MKFWINKSFYWHLILWFLYFFINFYNDIFYEDWTLPSGFYVLSYFSLIVFTFYLFYLFVAPKFISKSRFVIALLFFFVFIVLKFLLQEIFFPWIFEFNSNNLNSISISQYLEDNFFMAFVPAAAGTILHYFEQRRINEADQLKLINEKNEAELAFLRSQINPHFLFNTMSALHTRAFRLDSELADSIIKLSDILRYTLKSSQSHQIAIGDELKLIEDLIAIYKERFGEHCYANLEIIGTEFSQKFEPLLLMPFVENAFKHGVYSDPTNPIKFKLLIEKGQLFFSVQNKTKHQIKDEVSGIGLVNLKKRLQLMYPNKYDMEIKDDGNYYFASIKIQLS